MVDLGPQEGPPPRHVEPWTHVLGHVLVPNPKRSFCSCGWSTSGTEVNAQVQAHLREAWPVLVPRLRGESFAQWRERVAVAHGQALEARERAWQKHRMGQPIQPGQPIPFIPQEYSRADEHVQVLEQQLADILQAEL